LEALAQYKHNKAKIAWN